MTKPKVLFFSHENDMPWKKRAVLEEIFDLGTHGADWSYGWLSAGWKLRGWDVIVCQTVYHGFLASLWAPGTPIVVENHGDLELRNKWIARFVIKRAKGLRAVSRWTARQFGDGTVVDMFPAWTDAETFWMARRTRKSPIFTVLYAGGLDRHKGYGVAYELSKRMPVKFVSGVCQAKLAVEMARAHVVVVPSLREGLGLVAVEAMMVGTPVVASRVGGLREVIRHGVNGILVKAGDVDEFERQIWRLVEDKELRKGITDEATKFVWKFWTLEGFVNGYRNLVERAMRRG